MSVKILLFEKTINGRWKKIIITVIHYYNIGGHAFPQWSTSVNNAKCSSKNKHAQ